MHLNTLSRLSDPYVKTLPSRQPIRTIRQPIRIEYYVTRVVSQSESSITLPKNTRELSARVEDPSRLWARVSSLQPILIHEGLPPPCAAQLTLLLLV